MPGFVAAVGNFGLAALFGTGVASAAVIMGTGAAIIGFVTYTALRGARLRNSGDGGAATFSQQLLVRGTTEPRKIVYGEALVSGPVVFMNTAGTENRELYCVVALTGHEIESFQGFYIDDKFVPIADVDTAGDGDVDADTNDHGFGPVDGTPVLYLRGHEGASSQTADTMLDTAFADWTTNHRLRGCAYLVARMDRLSGAEEAWEAGAPSNISALVRGKRVYDPRLDSTFSGTWGNGSGSHRVNDTTTWEYSSNPALCLADYLIDSDLGAGFDAARINYNSVAITADDCDENVDVPVASLQDRFTCNGVLSCLDTHRENIEKIISSMGGTLRYLAGQWHISASMWPGASSFALTESDLVDDITFQVESDSGERYNAVRGVFFSPSRNYKESPYLQVEDATLQTNRDDGLVLWKEYDLPMTNDEYTAQRLAIRMLEQAARPGVCVFPMGYRGMDIAPGDRGTVTIEELGWNEKEFRCVAVRHVDLVGVELVLKEDDSGAYEDPDEADYGTRSGSAILTFPRIRTEPTSAGTSGILLADPFFSRSTRLWDNTGFSTGAHLGYFWRDNISSAGSTTTRILRTGGANAGALEVDFAAGSGIVTITSIPRDVGRISGEENLRMVWRVRKRDNPTLTSGQITFSCGLNDNVTNANLQALMFSALVPFGTINGWAVDVWQSVAASGTLSSFASYTHAVVEMSTAVAMSHAITIEVDSVTLYRVAP